MVKWLILVTCISFLAGCPNDPTNPPTDSGVPPDDATVVVDSGQPADTGVKIDSGISLDAGSKPDSGEPEVCTPMEGKWRVTYTEARGTCGDRDSESFEFQDNVIVPCDGCTLVSVEEDEDRCATRFITSCPGSSVYVDTLKRVDEDTAEGTSEVARRDCAGKYTTTWVSIPN